MAKRRAGIARMTWVGDEELAKGLETMTKTTSGKVLRAAVKAGADVVRAEAYRRALRVSNREAAAEIMVEKMRGGKGKAATHIGVQGGANPGFILRFSEYGTSPFRIPATGRTQRSSGATQPDSITRGSPSVNGKMALSNQNRKYGRSQAPFGPVSGDIFRGAQRATPWLRPAWDSSREQARDVIKQHLGDEIRRAAKETHRSSQRAIKPMKPGRER